MDQDSNWEATTVTAQGKKDKDRRTLSASLLKFLKEAAIIVAAALVLILLAEITIRIIYRVRNSRVEPVPVIYTIHNLGFVPPWMDELRILEPDERLLCEGPSQRQA
jgi:hypothetical protein